MPPEPTTLGMLPPALSGQVSPVWTNQPLLKIHLDLISTCKMYSKSCAIILLPCLINLIIDTVLLGPITFSTLVIIQLAKVLVFFTPFEHLSGTYFLFLLDKFVLFTVYVFVLGSNCLPLLCLPFMLFSLIVVLTFLAFCRLTDAAGSLLELSVLQR